MNTRHPSYPNPTIVEALCEIHFVPDLEREWTTTEPMPLYKRIESDFPKMEVHPEGTIQIRIGTPSARLRFTNVDNTRLLQIPGSGEAFVYNILRPYPGWNAVISSLSRLWAETTPILRPKRLSRVGVRYINRIPHSSKARYLENWLKPTRRIPIALIESRSKYSYRLEFSPDKFHRLIEKIAFSPPSRVEAFGATLFDLDHIWENPHGAALGKLEEILVRLHDEVWREFAAAQTPTLEAFLKKKNRGG